MRILRTGLLLLLMISVVDAAPRGRRARRRASRQAPARQINTQPTYANRPVQVQTQPIRTTAYGTPSASAPSYQAATSYSTPSNVISSSNVPFANAAPTNVSSSNVTYANVSPSYAPATSNSTTSVTQASYTQDATSPRPMIDGTVVAMNDAVPTIESSPVTTDMAPVPDPLPSIDSQSSLTEREPYCASCTVIPAGQSFNSALSELNSIRASRGLPPLVEDPSLSALAHQKASIQANRGAMFHPGGSMGGARFEGVGMGPRFTSCYQDATNVRYAGAATVVGRNGQRFHCLLVK